MPAQSRYPRPWAWPGNAKIAMSIGLAFEAFQYHSQYSHSAEKGKADHFSLSYALYFPVTVDVMRRVACHSVEALLVSVDDARGPLWGSGRCPTVFYEVAVATSASLGNGRAPARGATALPSGEEPAPRSPWTGRGVWRPCTPGDSQPAGLLRGGAADSPGPRRTAGPLPACVWPPGGALPPASDPATSLAPALHCVGGGG